MWQALDTGIVGEASMTLLFTAGSMSQQALPAKAWIGAQQMLIGSAYVLQRASIEAAFVDIWAAILKRFSAS